MKSHHIWLVYTRANFRAPAPVSNGLTGLARDFAGVRGLDEGARGPPERALLAVRLQAGPGRGAAQGDAAAARRALAVRGRGETRLGGVGVNFVGRRLLFESQFRFLGRTLVLDHARS